MEFRDDTEVLFEVIDILADTPILKEIKEKEKQKENKQKNLLKTKKTSSLLLR